MKDMKKRGDSYGVHRVLDSAQRLPQSAEKLDASLPIYSNEILIQIEKINVDSTSFRQLCESVQDSASPLTLPSPHQGERVSRAILDLVKTRGKLHNPVTNSGGMLVGTVKEIGPDYQGDLSFKVGDRVATLVSLTLTPLHLEKIEAIDLKTGQLSAQGYAILFESGIGCKLPTDISQPIALAVLDICGAPALVLRHCKKGDHVLFVGAGKSAKLSAAAIRQKWKRGVKITSVDPDQNSLEEMKRLGLADEIICGDATSPLTPLCQRGIGGIYDLVVNVTNIPNTEMASILSVRDGGTVIFFGMGTSFTKVALGAEGVGKDANFVIGSGYVKGHAELALEILRKNVALREWFERKYE